MRLLIDHGGYAFTNQGDLLMLGVGLARLYESLPSLETTVLSHLQDPPLYPRRGIDVMSPVARDALISVYQASKRRAPWINPILWLPHNTRYAVLKSVAKVSGVLKGQPSRVSTADKQFATANGVIALGGGYLAPDFPNMIASTSRLLRMAQERGKVTALMGQGLGPFCEPVGPELSEALSNADLISLREGTYAPEFLTSLGVSKEKVIVSGDDATEPSFALRKKSIGTSIGVCLRVAQYAGPIETKECIIGRVVAAASQRFNADLQALPISFDYASDDAGALARLGCKEIANWRIRPSPIDVIRYVSNCRVVLSGCYHAAVFSLAQGIPVVAICATDYYYRKFRGLADLYEVGCILVDQQDLSAHDKLGSALDQLWSEAPTLRSTLLKAAERQIRISRLAYDRLSEILSARKHGGG